MSRPMRRYVEKFEADDLLAGTYHARRLPPRARYNRQDFLDYLSAMEALDAEDLFAEFILEEDDGGA